MFQRRQRDYRLHKNVEVHVNRSFHVLMMYSNYAINISVIIGSVMTASTKTLQFISVTVLKIIFKWHTGKLGLRPHGLDAQALDAWTLALLTLRLCRPGRLDAWALDVWTQDNWALGIWTTGRQGCGRLHIWTLDGWTLR